MRVLSLELSVTKVENWRLFYEDKFNQGSGFDRAGFFHIKAEVVLAASMFASAYFFNKSYATVI